MPVQSTPNTLEAQLVAALTHVKVRTMLRGAVTSGVFIALFLWGILGFVCVTAVGGMR